MATLLRTGDFVGGRMWSRRNSYVQTLFARMMIRSALQSIFSAADFSGAVLSMASIGIEDEDVRAGRRP
jgi:hypothetical protein